MLGIFPNCISDARNGTTYPQWNWFHKLPKSPYEANRPYSFDSFARNNTLFIDEEAIIVYFKCFSGLVTVITARIFWCKQET